MKDKPVISLDGMGGDDAPKSVVEGAAQALERRPDIRFIIYGDEALLCPLVNRHPALKEAATLVHTEAVVAMDDPPAQALRKGRRVSSMWQGIWAVKTGEADAAVSAGNTGALMAMGKVILKTVPGVRRPVLAALWPNLKGIGVVLDLGAGVSQDVRQLVESAVMGEAYARVLLDKTRPRVGLLNVGVEGIKGTDSVREAARILSENEDNLHLDFHGFVEGDDIGRGTVDVVVTDGFTGNVALKTAEGTARQFSEFLRNAIRQSIISRIGYVFARGAFGRLRDAFNPGSFNGAGMLGLKGIVVKSHGSADSAGYSFAILAAVRLVESDLAENVKQAIQTLDHVVVDETGWGDRTDKGDKVNKADEIGGGQNGVYEKERKLAV
ncbi:MAG: phosphate acyltransferase PlsX [Parvularculales bacterium]